METRRETLKIIGAVGATCAFPFSADELYGQHVHHTATAQAPPAGPFQPKFFTKSELETIARIADLIIPATDTPGAVAAGVPQYIDHVVSVNEEHQKRYRAGLEWLKTQNFLQLTEDQQIAILTPLSEAVDRDEIESAGEKFFRAMKSMTADGYYTSRVGLLQELGYKGNTVLARFPESTIPEH